MFAYLATDPLRHFVAAHPAVLNLLQLKHFKSRDIQYYVQKRFSVERDVQSVHVAERDMFYATVSKSRHYTSHVKQSMNSMQCQNC